MHIIIVGAGIAGLASAVALRKDHKVTVVEKSRLKAEVGAAIHLGPNASKIVVQWGFDQKRVGSVEVVRVVERNAANETLLEIPIDARSKFGGPWLLNHRVDLHNELKRLATEGDDPVELLTGKAVADIDCEGGIVTFADGSTMSADVIVGADGIHSIVRDAVLGKALPAEPSGHSAYRLLIPAEKIPEKFQDVLQGGLTVWLAGDRRIVAYCCRDMTLLNIVAMIPDSSLHEKSVESWSSDGDLAHLLESFKGFDKGILDLLAAAGKCGLWQLKDRSPLDTWIKGHTCVIGDAAHAMLPHQGQGGGQSIEDAEALAYFLKGVDRAGVPTALKKFEAARIGRASQIQAYSRQIALGAKVQEDGKVDAPINAAQFSEYNYGYNGIESWVKAHNLASAVST